MILTGNSCRPALAQYFTKYRMHLKPVDTGLDVKAQQHLQLVTLKYVHGPTPLFR